MNRKFAFRTTCNNILLAGSIFFGSCQNYKEDSKSVYGARNPEKLAACHTRQGHEVQFLQSQDHEIRALVKEKGSTRELMLPVKMSREFDNLDITQILNQYDSRQSVHIFFPEHSDVKDIKDQNNIAKNGVVYIGYIGLKGGVGGQGRARCIPHTIKKCPKGLPMSKCEHECTCTPPSSPKNENPSNNKPQNYVGGNPKNNYSHSDMCARLASIGTKRPYGSRYGEDGDRVDKEQLEKEKKDREAKEAEDKRWEQIEQDIINEHVWNFAVLRAEIEAKTKACLEEMARLKEAGRIQEEQRKERREHLLKTIKDLHEEIKKKPATNWKDVFIAESSTYDVEEINETIEELLEDIEDDEISKGKPLSEKLRKRAIRILPEIIEQFKIIKPQYKALKIKVENANPSNNDPELKDDIKDAEIAKKLLKDLEKAKAQLKTILEDHAENPKDYGYDDNASDSDPENNYTKAQLSEVLNSHNVGPSTQEIKKIKSAIAKQLPYLIKQLGNNQNVTPEEFTKLLWECPELLQNIESCITNKGDIENLCGQIIRAVVQGLQEPASKAFTLNNLDAIKTQFLKLKVGINNVMQKMVCQLQNNFKVEEKKEEDQKFVPQKVDKELELIRKDKEAPEAKMKAEKTVKLLNPSGSGIRNDSEGLGHFGAPRARKDKDGKPIKSTHDGIDLITTIGQDILSPIDGRVMNFFGKRTKYPMLQIYPSKATNDFEYIEILYVNAIKGETIDVFRKIKEGATIGIAVDLKECGYSKGVTPHIHLQMWKDGKIINPTPFFF